MLARPVDSPIARKADAGSSFDFGASDIHREPNGQLRRHAVSYEVELREPSATS